MPYYGDYYAGDPGLFSFVKKIKLGKLLGGIVKTAIGTTGILTAVNAIRKGATAPPPAPAPTARVVVPTTTPGGTVRVTKVIATRAGKARARFTSSGKAVSPFAQRMAAARAAAARRRGQ